MQCLVPRNISQLPCHPSDKCGVAGIVHEQRKGSDPVPEMLWSNPRIIRSSSSLRWSPSPVLVVHAAYSTYTAPASYGSVGATHESTIKGYGGNSVISQYSKAVDSAYSSVRKYDTRISNDAQALAYAPAYAPASYAAPAIASYGGYAAPALAARAYATPAISAYGGYAAPALAARAYAAPAISAYGGYAAPALAARAYGAPALASYGGYAAPALAARAYGAPAVASYGGYAAPALAAHAYAAPGLSAYGAPAGIVSHVSFAGLGANYGW
uniref:Uncharacterized protein n=1 Tax=Timema cristinae TaxID=61476 RepID=A0A7R9HAR5_TIMCR|nr:unnamed protein product [Timema cristinae]